MSSRPNPPKNHHFIPEFLLRQWAGEDGRVTRYTRVINDKIVGRRVYPSQAGFREHLYTHPYEKDPCSAALLETKILQKIDDGAAEQLPRLLEGATSGWDSNNMSAWTSFILSLLHRTPAHMVAHMNVMKTIWSQTTPEVQEKYARIRSPGDPEMVEDYLLALDPDIKERTAFEAFAKGMTPPNLGQHLINLRWRVVDLSQARHRLLISDASLVLAPLARPTDLCREEFWN